MKFTVNREKLQKALQRVGSINTSRTILPLLNNVLIEAADGQIKLTTTDLELRISTTVEAAVEVPGATTAPSRKLSSLVGSMSGDEVAFDVDESDHLGIRCGTGRFTLLGLPAGDFPEVAEFANQREVKIKESDLKRMVGSVAYAVSVDDSRKVLTGILLSMHDSMLTMVATDGKRMALQEGSPESITGENGEVIVPLRTMNELKRLADGGDAVMTMGIGDKQCIFTGHNFELSSKLIEGNYPNYRQVLPTKFNSQVELPTALLKSKIQIMSLLLPDNNAFVIFHFEENQLRLTASSSEVGEGSDSIEIEFSGTPFEVSFNPAFMLDPLNNTDAASVTVKINDPLNPVMMESGEGFIYVIMPIRKK